MADLLSHVLMAYIVVKLLSLRYDWLRTPYISAAMLGAVLPDLSRLYFIVSAETVEALTGLHLSWQAMHRVGGIALTIAIIAYLVPRVTRRRLVAVLALGAGMHLLADTFLGSGVGPAGDFLWPLTTWEPVVPRFYGSPDIRIAPILLALAAATWATVEWYTDRDTVPPAEPAGT